MKESTKNSLIKLGIWLAIGIVFVGVSCGVIAYLKVIGLEIN